MLLLACVGAWGRLVLLGVVLLCGVTEGSPCAANYEPVSVPPTFTTSRCCPVGDRSAGSVYEVKKMAVYASIAYESADTRSYPSDLDNQTDIIASVVRGVFEWGGPYFVVRDACLGAIVVAYRGTQIGVKDLLTDIHYSATELFDGVYAHKGFSHRAQQVVDEQGANIANIVAQTGYRLVFAGHSLGAGVTSLLTVLFANPATSPFSNKTPLPKISGYGWATPLSTLYDPQGIAAGFLTSFNAYLYRDDFVGRISIASAYEAAQACETVANSSAGVTMLRYVPNAVIRFLHSCASDETRGLSRPGKWYYTNDVSSAFAAYPSTDSSLSVLRVTANALEDHAMANYHKAVDNSFTLPPNVFPTIGVRSCPSFLRSSDPSTCPATPLMIGTTWMAENTTATGNSRRGVSSFQNIKVIAHCFLGVGILYQPTPETGGQWMSFFQTAEGNIENDTFATLPAGLSDLNFHPVSASVSELWEILVAIDNKGIGKVWHLADNEFQEVQFVGIVSATDVDLISSPTLSVLVVDGGGGYLATYSVEGGPPSQKYYGFNSPSAATLNDDATVAFVIDTGGVLSLNLASGLVETFDLSFENPWTLAQSGSKYPIALASKNGFLYVLDSNASTLFIYNEFTQNLYISFQPTNSDSLAISDYAARMLVVANSSTGVVQILLNNKGELQAQPLNWVSSSTRHHNISAFVLLLMLVISYVLS